MAQAPINIHSQQAPHTPPAGRSLSYTKEKAKQELFQAISDQNIRHGAWEKGVKDRYQEKIEKYKTRGNSDEKAVALATKQIQRVWAKVFKDKLATPGTSGGNGFYKNVGDSDGEGAIFLLKKYIFGKKQSFTTYLSHEAIEKNAQSSDLKDKDVLKFFLDGGGVPGMTVTAGKAAGIKSPWHGSRIVMDHHPEGPTSTTGMVAKLLEMTGMIPEADKKIVQRFVQTIDIADSFLSKAGRTMNVEKDYAKTLISFSYQLESDELYKLCTQLPDNVGALTPLPDNLLSTIEVTMKGKKDLVKLSECVAKKQVNVNTGKEMISEKIKQKQFVTIEGKKFLIFGPKDNISNDVRALLSAEHDFGTIKVHETGDMFIVHDQGIPVLLNAVTHTIRDVIMVINTNTTNNKLKESAKKFYDLLPECEGKKYIFSLLAKLFGEEKSISEKNEKKEAGEIQQEPKEKKDTIPKEEKKAAESFVEKVAESPTVSNNDKKTEKVSFSLPKLDTKEMFKGFRDFGSDLKDMRGSFRKWLRRGK